MIVKYGDSVRWLSKVEGHGFPRPESGPEESFYIDFSVITAHHDDEHRNL